MSYNEPVGHTCPKIDTIIDYMERASNEAKYLNKHSGSTFLTAEDIDESSNEIISILECGIGEIEDIRDDNGALREWGREEQDRADNLSELYEEACSELELLKERVSELEAEVQSLYEEKAGASL